MARVILEYWTGDEAISELCFKNLARMCMETCVLAIEDAVEVSFYLQILFCQHDGKTQNFIFCFLQAGPEQQIAIHSLVDLCHRDPRVLSELCYWRGREMVDTLRDIENLDPAFVIDLEGNFQQF